MHTIFEGSVQIIFTASAKSHSNLYSMNPTCDSTNYFIYKEVVLVNNGTFKINMTVKYAIENGQHIPVEDGSVLTGLVSGYNWEFIAVDTNNFVPSGKNAFRTTGILKWNLLGVTVYRERKVFNAIIK